MMLFFYFYVPETHIELVKDAVFDAGAGKFKNYDHCCWQTEGVGQFRPLEGSTPHIGKTDCVEKVKEYKIEMICENRLKPVVVKALLNSHPYEEPAFGFLEINCE